ncbi:TIGR00730 family Rossman fold protein [Corynebacterium pygosceleis]|uniref:TIGR00730 family Rossman fold protein n=1 Tax=Corynebacterium pygosceleis TaxID=2800406 RepID=UPI00190362FD|nr:TIGR00730 family Rossman fold protein [Corynebacterium pygosceleis]MCK7675919.1 TIGR00730 family Rossman fold protein [Corynebacterium pygosceleis]MCL0119954.1 TIGR00730 family Rossman fold protein [Corynebacterium pygosceleis]
MTAHATDNPVNLRPMTVADLPLREWATIHNVGADADTTDNHLAPYLQFIPQRGDTGMVAEVRDPVTGGNRTAGVVWASFIRSHGYISPEIPELSVSVDDDFQGAGIGTTLIRAVVDHGRNVGWPGISLYVEDDNPARRLYARLGFESLACDSCPGTMVMHLTPPINRVAVYCGSAPGARTEYAHAARDIGRALAERDIDLVYGGGDVGLMGVVADAVIEAGGQTIGVMPRSLVELEIAHDGLSSLEVVETMAERKSRMEELSDAFIVLPGGAGTLEELFQVFTRQQLVAGTGPIVLFNADDYWNPLFDALERMCDEGFIERRYLDALIVTDDTGELFAKLAEWRAPGTKWENRELCG